ncbi:palmitoyltransferase for Vac8p [Tulasnella sp. 427]|nr:palmitoyltransferase for Vac8p [Tulasnella sp. 427]
MSSNTKLNLKPLLSFELQPPALFGRRSPPARAGDDYSPSDAYEDTSGGHGPRKKSWIAYIPTVVALAFIVGPQVPLFVTLVRYYLPRSPALFLVHLSVTYTLTFIVLTCFLVVLARDPGPVDGAKAQTIEDRRFQGPIAEEDEDEDEDGDDEGISLAEALMKPSASDTPWAGYGERRWCQKCWSPKPERTHHCGECGRCVLKMDHHCPWLGAKCIGHRTYPAFIHLLFTITLLCLYSFALTIPPLRSYLDLTTIINEDDWTPYFVLLLAIITFIFGLMIGSFWGYHVYLISTNQTTLEQLTPFLLLRHIPPLPMSTANPTQPPSNSQTLGPQSNRHRPDSPYFFPSPPPDRASFSEGSSTTTQVSPGTKTATTTAHKAGRVEEHLLSSDQRRRVRYAARKIRLYDLGSVRENWEEVVGGRGKAGSRWTWWLNFIVCGGKGKGDGYTFEFNPTARRKLDRLAEDLAKL